jgi:hypothetical protein
MPKQKSTEVGRSIEEMVVEGTGPLAKTPIEEAKIYRWLQEQKWTQTHIAEE